MRTFTALRARAAAAALPAFLAAGCAGVGPQRLDMDQMGYAAALGDGLKRQTLLNMVRLRYADVPAFVSVTQLISGYTLQNTAQIGLNAYPNAAPGNYANVFGNVQYTTRPTFTFTPVTGERFAQSYLRPLAPAELLSLAQSGAPVDLLFRLGVQSVNDLSNAATRGGEAQGASEGFQALMRALREVQAGGSVGVRFERRPKASRVFVLLDGHGPGAAAAAREARRLLGIDPSRRELEVVYGRGPRMPGQVAVLTRSVLQILHELGSHIEVSEADLQRGETTSTAAVAAAESRERLMLVRQGRGAPPDAFAAVSYRDRWYWIDAGDYRSKAAFTFVHVLQTLAETGSGQSTPVVTIPAQ